MAIPHYHAGLRAKIGNDLIWAPGVTVLVLRDKDGRRQILLQQRSDIGTWNPICGSVDPGEDPDVCAVREAREEAGIAVELDALLGVEALPVTVLPNGHTCQYLDLVFAAHPCDDGEGAHVADDESLQMRWFDVDDLPELDQRFTNSLGRALAGDHGVRFGLGQRVLPGTG